MNKRKKKANKSGKFWALVLILVVAYFSTQGDLSALSELPALDNLPSLSEVVSSKETPSNPKTPSSGKVKPTEGLEIPALEKKRKEVILYRSNYTLSFNKETNLPNWVAWRLDKKKLAQKVNRERYGFAADPDMEGVNAVVTQDYARSGYDRGHMCPANDSRWSGEAMKESFYMTNICPQNHNLNSGDWNELEQACHRWAEQQPVYIVCGPILYKKSQAQYIGKEHQIRVPEAFFKVVLTGVEKGNPRAIGFIYKNAEGNRPLDAYVNTVDQVERITGFDFFPALPDEVEAQVESQYTMKDWK